MFLNQAVRKDGFLTFYAINTYLLVHGLSDGENTTASTDGTFLSHWTENFEALRKCPSSLEHSDNLHEEGSGTLPSYQISWW